MKFGARTGLFDGFDLRGAGEALGGFGGPGDDASMSFSGLIQADARDVGADAPTVAAPADGPAPAPQTGLTDANGPASAAFVAGNIVVERIGTGGATVLSNRDPVSIVEYAPTGGAAVQTITLAGVFDSGTASSNGLMTRSTDGRYLIVSGTTGDQTTANASVRSISRIDASGTVDSSTTFTNASLYAANNFRGAASTDGTSIWTGGTATSTGGVRYIAAGGSSSTLVASAPTNVRAVEIFNNQLYISSASGANIGISIVGSGLPTTSGPAATLLAGTGSSTNAYQFFFADLSAAVAGLDTLYVADQSAGLQKYALVAGTWTLLGAVGALNGGGVTATVSGTTVSLYATAGSGQGNLLVGLTDTAGYNVTFSSTTGTTIATAPANTVFRGVALAPQAAGDTTPPTLTSSTPADNATGVAVGANIVLNFSETVQAGTGSIILRPAAGGDIVIAVTDTTQVTLAGSQVTINPTADLAAGTAYDVIIASGVITDSANNPFAGIALDALDFITATPTPNLSINNVQGAEVAGAQFTFTVTLSAPAPAGGVTFDITTVSGTAISGQDFVGRTLTGQTIAAGQTTYAFTVNLTPDMLIEDDETFSVNVTNVTGANVTNATGTGLIVDALTISTPGAYQELSGVTRTLPFSGLSVAASTGAVSLQIDGAINSTGSGNRALNIGAGNGGSSVSLGATGTVQSLAADAIRSQTTTGTVNLTNLGQILVSNNGTVPAPGGPDPGNAHAVNWNAAVGTSAAANDFTSGGTITNGSSGNSTASITNNFFGDAVRLGSHMTLVNYGTINAAGAVNDTTTGTNFYSSARGVRLDTANTTAVTVTNFGSIAGSQHGFDTNSGASNIAITNNAGGSFIGRNGSGIGSDSVQTNAASISITNAGTISGRYAGVGNIIDRGGNASSDGDGDGIDIDGAATVNNLAGGIVEGTGAGGFDSGGRANRSEGISLGGGVINNQGIIRGADFAIIINNDSNANGSRSGVAATSLSNYAGGAITGQGGFAVRFENKTGGAADIDTIVNYGTITGNGTIPAGTVLLQDGSADPRTVGTLDGVAYTAADAGSARFIRGDGSAIQTGEGADLVDNYGSIVGNSGRAINLEGGDDRLGLHTGQSITGLINGGAGTDELVLVVDDRTGGDPRLGANSGVTSGSLSNVINFETLTVTSGGWTLADSQTYSSGVTVQAGATLTVANGAILNIGGASVLSGSLVNNGGLVVNAVPSASLNGVISGTGALNKVGFGPLTLGGTNSYSGGTTIFQGTLILTALGAAGTGTINFFNGIAQTLAITNAALGTDAAHTFGNTIASFGTDGDVVDLTGVTFATSTVAYNATSGALTFTDRSSGNVLATVNIGSFANAALSVSQDSSGGTAASLIANQGGITGFAGTAGDNNYTGTAAADLFNLSQGGNDTVNGGAGDDGFYFGATFTAADSVDGGAGTLDQIGLQGNYAGLVLGAATMANVENLVLLSGGNTNFDDPGGSLYSYNITTNDANIAAGQVLAVSANTLTPGEFSTFNASAELDGSLIYYGGRGRDIVTGSQTNDAFFFQFSSFSAADVVNGQGGDLDQLVLQGGYSGAFGANQIVSIENLVLISSDDVRYSSNSAYNYTITMADGNVAAGASFAVSANMLATDEALILTDTAETNAAITVYSGAGNDQIRLGALGDTVFGGAGNDLIIGNGGADQLRGGTGNDTFGYQLVTDSTTTASDHIFDFGDGDKIDLTAIGALTFVGGGFTGTGQLHIVDQGNGNYLVEANTTGDTAPELSILVTGINHVVTQADLVFTSAPPAFFEAHDVSVVPALDPMVNYSLAV